ncbi:hypothetical protein [Pseudomonas sp.]|uniref:hypothetical protein n=1 Tax=Pseudomonas sp. TaxID=306 RepID=UPI003C72E18A
MDEFKLGQQNYPNKDRCGSYRTASRLHEGIINPGEFLNLSQYITGYGLAEGFKIQVYISNQIFDDSESYVLNGLEHLSSTKSKVFMGWGAKRSQVTGHNFKIMLAGVSVDGSKSSSIFDTQKDTTFIMSEEDANLHAPFEYRLKTRNNAKPGTYYISFYLTYFNGEGWICEEERTSFRINNKFEQYSAALSFLAATALVVTIIHDGLIPLLDSIHELGKFMMNRK